MVDASLQLYKFGQIRVKFIDVHIMQMDIKRFLEHFVSTRSEALLSFIHLESFRYV